MITRILEITITNKCNKRCKYCFENGYNCTESRDEELRQIRLIEDLCTKLSGESDHILQLSLWGGEPLLNEQFISDIFRATEKFDFVRYLIYSNGTLVDNWSRFISLQPVQQVLNRITVRLSWDGEPHQSLNRYAGDATLLTWRFLKEKGVCVVFKPTIMLENVDLLPEVWDSFAKLHEEDSSIEYFPNLDTMKDDATYIDKFSSAMKIIAKREYDRIRNGKSLLMGWFYPHVSKNRCCLDNMIHIHTDGSIYNCHGGPYIKNHDKIRLGKTSEITSLYPLFRTYEINAENEVCLRCEAKACLVCHMAQLHNPQSPSDVIENWEKCRCCCGSRCLYYKFFGRLHRAFWDAVRTNDVSKIDAVV